MRLDKFLKLSRLVKRRPVAKELADAGRVKINDQVAKAASEVKVGDILELGFGNREVRVRVVELREHVRKEAANNLYELI
ncbi:MAG: RNA-binding S4 domain-containing protein [Eubacteriales bacterium]|nr:RNA-binding S4 domain-containing protein [Eubacteriales bacterium]